MSQAFAPTTAEWVIGVDVGGTFTDIIAVNRATNEVRDGKVLSTSAQEEGVLAAIKSIGLQPDLIHELVHGHTVGINAVLSRKGATTGLICTAGHRDLLDIGRMNREFGEGFYDPNWQRPHLQRPIIARRLRVGVPERINGEGSEALPLDEDAVRAAAQQLVEAGAQAIAVCFLNAYNNGAHEARAVELVRSVAPDMYVQSSALYPVTKEHERTTTVALDAYVGPAVNGYLRRLASRLQDADFGGSLWIMMMNGGVADIDEASRAPVFQLVSGPVGGVAGAVAGARANDLRDLVTMDIGGTSTDVAMITDGQTPLTDLWTIEHGLTLTMPLVDVGSVGSGAGSIISVDDVGSLRVGPESAGSVPGPACYDRGGVAPTITDACCALGILQPDLFAGGTIRLQDKLAIKALARVAPRLGLGELDLAVAAYQVACEDIAAKIRSTSVYRGVDIRQFSLLAFGAAGPMLANRVAEILGVKSVVVPPSPGQFSALGLLKSDLRLTRARSPMMPLAPSAAERLETLYVELEDSIRQGLQAQGADAEVTFSRAFFAMYAGQTWDNRMTVGGGPVTAETVTDMVTGFHDFYRTSYGFAAPELPVILTSVEVTGVVRRQGVEAGSRTEAGESLLRTADVVIPGAGNVAVPVHRRSALGPDAVVTGPALVVEDYATTVVLPGHEARTQGDLLLIEREESRA